MPCTPPQAVFVNNVEEGGPRCMAPKKAPLQPRPPHIQENCDLAFTPCSGWGEADKENVDPDEDPVRRVLTYEEL